jgi:N-acetylglucosaminyl-diphospho-decaprenol L-rhamnosyltransferase
MDTDPASPRPSESGPPTVAVIIVTYSSDRVLPACLEALAKQTRQPDLILVVDNCSPQPAYLDAIPIGERVRLVRNRVNLGFCAGNNVGYRLSRHHKYVLFLNPDAFPREDFIENALAYMERETSSPIGILTGTLLGFDVERRRPTGRIDSTGVFQTWYGRWYDRGQGLPWNEAVKAEQAQEVPAICGALMFCRTQALEATRLQDGEIFDPGFFMYKEDIDLSLRLRRHGWKLLYRPELLCYHGRGWQGRGRMAGRAKYLSARNELRVCLRNRLRGLPYSMMKYAYVLAGLGVIAAARKWGELTHARPKDQGNRP